MQRFQHGFVRFSLIVTPAKGRISQYSMTPLIRYSALFLCLTAAIALQAREITIVAHRGANHLAPENTYAAAWICVELGVEYVEVDVRTSSDGVMYIIHDKTLDRTTNGSGPVAEASSVEIDRLDAGSWFDPKFSNQKVPKLKDFLNTFRNKIKVYFDVKDANLKDLLALIRETGFENDCFFWFSNDERAKELRRLDPKIGLKMNAVDVAGLQRVLAYNPQIIEYRLSNLTPEFVAFCRDHDLKLMAHALHSDAEKDYQHILDSAADMVNLDRADEMIKLAAGR